MHAHVQKHRYSVQMLTLPAQVLDLGAAPGGWSLFVSKLQSTRKRERGEQGERWRMGQAGTGTEAGEGSCEYGGGSAVLPKLPKLGSPAQSA